MANRRIEALRAYLRPAKPDRDASLVRHLVVGQPIEQLGRLRDRTLRAVDVPEAQLGEGERAAGADFDHPFAAGGKRCTCPFSDGVPVRVQDVGERQNSLELGCPWRVLLGQCRQLVQQQLPRLVITAKQLVQHRGHHSRLQPQGARISRREAQERAQRLPIVLHVPRAPERGCPASEEP